MASYSKLCILFFNILKNAVEAVEDKGSIVTTLDKQGDMAVITVTDNGKGIDESLYGAVDQPFVTDKADGMGLGLTISKKIASEYQGNISIENIKPHGCRVTILLKTYQETIA
jgi:C4-dicarboxylate-specific signal transduction histidine kinase